MVDDETLERIKELKVADNCVMIAGYPKSGNHFILQILSSLGYERLYGESDGYGENFLNNQFS